MDQYNLSSSIFDSLGVYMSTPILLEDENCLDSRHVTMYRFEITTVAQ